MLTIKKSKAQTAFIEYVFIILVGVFVLVGVSYVVISLQNAAIENSARSSLTQLAIQTSDSIVRMYDTSKSSEVSPSTNSSVLVSNLKLNFPTDVAKRNYRIQLVPASGIWAQVTSVNTGGVNITATNGSLMETTSSAKVIAETLQTPIVTVEYLIQNIGASVQGISENGLNDELNYYRTNFNGTVSDKIVLGNSSSLIDLRVVS